MRGLFLVGVVFLGCAHPLPRAASGAHGIRAREVLAHEERAGAKVTVEIFEPLLDSAHTTAADDGAFDVQVFDAGDSRLAISPATTEPPPAPRSPRGERASRRVRLTGFVSSASGHYGHLGMADTRLDVTDIVYLDPARRECR